MNIEPTYVTFEQAKLLKEKRFNENCYAVIDIEKSKIINPFLSCNSELIKQAFSRPEQWQVCEWFRVEKGIHIEILLTESSPYNTFYYRVMKVGQYFTLSHDDVYFTTPQEAYSAAFDCILNELI